jgi:hypothetical protein
MMKPILVFLAAWLFAGLGAVIGSVLGNAAGKVGLFVGALLGGIVGVAAAVAVTSRLGWILASDRRGAFVGGIVGFAIAAPIAVANLHWPIVPVFSCGLAGAGLLAGLGFARGWQRSS